MTEYLGCSSHSCYIEKPIGMGTNGRCSCLDKLERKQRLKVQKCLLNLHNEIKDLKASKG